MGTISSSNSASLLGGGGALLALQGVLVLAIRALMS